MKILKNKIINKITGRKKYNNIYLPNNFILVNKYKIITKISSGGFGAVYMVKSKDGRTYAMKEFLPTSVPCRMNKKTINISIDNDKDRKKFNNGLDSFFQESDTIRKINHKNIIQVFDVFRANGTAYFTMPLEIGTTLNYIIRNEKEKLTEEFLINIFIQACDGLHTLHSHNLLHLDIKPNNLWVRPDNSLVILDLGAARYRDNYHLLAPPARTPGYAAPEQHNVSTTKRAYNLTPQTDIYGLSASLYACINGQPPKIAKQRSHKDQTLFNERKGQYSDQLLKLIDKGLSLSIYDRVQSVSEFRNILLSITSPFKNNQIPNVFF